MSRCFVPVNPATVILRCLTRRCGSVASDTPPNVWPIISTPTQSGISIGQEEFSDTAVALFDPMASTPSNESTLQMLANQFTNDYLNWRQTELDLTFTGLCAVAPQGIADSIVFDYGDTDGACRTRITSGPYSSPCQQLGHQIPNPDCSCQDVDPQHTSTWTPYIRMFGPPTLDLTGAVTPNEYLLSLEDGRLKLAFFPPGSPDCVSNVTINTQWCINFVAPGTITVTIRSGACPGGAVVATATANTAGIATFNLPAGTYCASASTSTSGYLNQAQTFTIPVGGFGYAYTALYPAKLIVADATLGVTLNVFPYGPNGQVGGAPYYSDNYGGSVEFDYPETACCGGGTVTLWYEVGCGGGLCGDYSILMYVAGNYIITNPDVGLQIICASNDAITPDNIQFARYCPIGSLAYPANLLYTYGNGLGIGGTGALNGTCGINSLFGCAPSYTDIFNQDLGCTCPPLANTFDPPNCAFLFGVSAVSRSISVTQ